jgi:hypothetical protein
VLFKILTAEEAEDFAEVAEKIEIRLRRVYEEVRKHNMRKRMIWMAPAAIVGIVVFTTFGGEVVKLLWNWLAPALFGLPQITFWQAFGLLALCRILFGGFGGGGHRYKSRGMRERMAERCQPMTPEERERIRQGLNDRSRQTAPLDSYPPD